MNKFPPIHQKNPLAKTTHQLTLQYYKSAIYKPLFFYYQNYYEMKSLFTYNRSILISAIVLFLSLISYLNTRCYAQVPSGYEYSQEFLIDFGNAHLSTGNWTNVEELNTSYTLVSATGVTSGFSIEATSGLRGNNTDGIGGGVFINAGALADASLTTELGNMTEDNATRDYFYQNSSNSVDFNFSNLDINKKYRLQIFATRNSSESRTTLYSVNGATNVDGQLQTSGLNIGVSGHLNGNIGLLTLDALSPDRDGNITVTSTSTIFCYVGSCRLIEYSPNTVNKTFLVDFGNTEMTSPDASGNYWNNKNYSYQPINDMVDSENGSSGYQLAVTSGWGNSAAGAISDASTTYYTNNLAENNATSDYSFRSGGGGAAPPDFTMTFSNLTTSNSYRFKVFSSRNINVDQTNQFSFVGENTSTFSIMSSSVAEGANLEAQYSDYITPNASGEINLTISSNDINGQSMINALEMEEYVSVNASQEFLVDFGTVEQTASPDVNGSYWNNISTSNSALNLNSIDNLPSFYSIEMTKGGFGSNGGLSDPLLSDGLSSLAIESATKDYAFAASFDVHGGQDSVVIEISNLDVTKGYRFNVFATRGSVNDERITEYSFEGSNTINGELQTTGAALGTTGHLFGNLNLYSSDLVYPDNEGKIILKAKREEDTEYTYIGALRIEEFDQNPGQTALLYVPQDTDYAFFNLPVELIEFSAKLKDEEVLLNWATATEINNDYFEIERSIDGKQWQFLEKIKGTGNSNVRIDYQYSDTNPFQGESYYRLVQIDLDGTTTYFDPQKVNFQTNSSLEYTIFPNPLNSGNTLTIALSNPQQSTIEVQFLNGLGQKLDSFTIEEDTYRKSWIVPTLRKGIYYLRMKQNEVITVKKILIR